MYQYTLPTPYLDFDFDIQFRHAYFALPVVYPIAAKNFVPIFFKSHNKDKYSGNKINSSRVKK